MVVMWECGKRQYRFPYFHIDSFLSRQMNPVTICYSWFSHRLLFGRSEAVSTISQSSFSTQRGQRCTPRSELRVRVHLATDMQYV